MQLSGAQGIPHTCRLYRDANAKLPVWEQALGFEFGRLTYPQWRQLVIAYGAWHNRRNLASYDRDRNYALIDFMPPMIQSFNRHRFHEQDLTPSPPQPLSPRPSRTKLATNCWGTLYEILRLAKQFKPPAPTLFVTDSHPMLKVLRQHSTEIEGKTRPGDIVLVYHQHGNRQYLDHSALIVDQHLFFEKAGSGNHVPYRFIDRATLKRIWNPQIYTFEYRRPHPQHQWQPPERVFGKGEKRVALPPSTDGYQLTSASPITHFAMQQLPALISTNGRSRLSFRAYDPNLFLEQSLSQEGH